MGRQSHPLPPPLLHSPPRGRGGGGGLDRKLGRRSSADGARATSVDVDLRLLVLLQALEAAHGLQHRQLGLDLLAAEGVVLHALRALAAGPVDALRVVPFREDQDVEVEGAETAVGQGGVLYARQGGRARLALVGVALDELGRLPGRDGDGLAPDQRLKEVRLVQLQSTEREG